MTENNNVQDQARPDSGRAFFNRAAFHLPPVKANIIFWPLVASGIAFDLITKWAVFEWVADRGQVTIVDGVVRLVAVLNDGAAFGSFSGQGHFLKLISGLALLVLLGLFFFACPKEKILQVAMALATAGVCGNLYDRLFNNGLVRDFIDVVYWPGRHWPTFNVADSLLCIAVALMAVSIFVTGRPCQKYDRPQKSEPSTPR